MEIKQRYFLGKADKLKSRTVIKKVFSEGKHILAYPVKAVFIFGNENYQLQAGVSVSKRNFKKAVDRNRIKRLMRECYRLQKSILENHLVKKNQQLSIFLMYVGKEMPEFNQITESCEKIIIRVIKMLNENIEAHS